jgi:PAS domain S-box-containing protein
MKEGADDYILKDRMTRLPAAIDAALEKRESERGKEDALQQLKESEEKYRTLVERVSDAFIALDKNWQYTYLNKQAGELIHRMPEDMIGKNVWDEFPDVVGSSTYKSFHQAMAEQRYVSNIDYYAPFDLWQENHIYPSVDGLSVFIRDISVRKRLEQELLEQQRREQLKITAITLEAQEKERTMLGRELHDNVNQILVGTKMMLSMAKRNPDQHPNVVQSSIDNLQQAINENRRIAHELVAPDFKEESLLERIPGLAASMLRPLGIDILIDGSQFLESKLSAEQKVAIYRVAQEQCTNIVKYAEARQVKISLSTVHYIFKMIIADDGKGMNMGETIKGIGISNIRARMSIFNGTVEVVTGLGKGFALEVVIPLKK